MTSNRSRFTTFFALVFVTGLIPASQVRAQTPSARVYTVELIVFRNMIGQGGAEDWSVKPAARRPDQPDSPVTGRLVASLSPSQFQHNHLEARL
jgi:hypothetical protein